MMAVLRLLRVMVGFRGARRLLHSLVKSVPMMLDLVVFILVVFVLAAVMVSG